jgi:sugar phosphate isomerase/epimerase
MTEQPAFSLAYLTVFGTPPGRHVEIAAKAGYNHVGLRLTPLADGEEPFPLLTDPEAVRDLKQKLQDTGLGVLDVEAVRLGPDDDPEEHRRLIEVGREIGAKHLTVHLPDTDRGRATEHFARICQIAAPLGLTAELEFLPWTSTRDLAAAAEIVANAGQPNGGILVDSLHFFRSSSTVEQVTDLPSEVFRMVQLCDAPTKAPIGDEALIHAARTDRYLPGEGGLDLVSLVAALPDVPYSLEVPNEAMRRDMGTQEFARRVFEAGRRLVIGAAGVSGS